MSFSVRDLLADAVSRSDNSAADALLRVAGGPAAVTEFLRVHGIEGVRIDRGEGEIATQFGLEADRGRPPDEPSTVRLARLRHGFAAYLADPRDRATPLGAANLLRTLWQQRLLSRSSTQWLLELMARQAVPARLRAGLPSGIRLADRCGTSYSFEGHTAAYNDIGILIWPDGHAVIIAAFLMDSAAPERVRERLFADLARAVAEWDGSRARVRS